MLKTTLKLIHQNHLSCSAHVETNASQLVYLLTQLFDSRAKLCWLHDKGCDVIGLFPKWALIAKQIDGSAHMPEFFSYSQIQETSTQSTTTQSATQRYLKSEIIQRHYIKQPATSIAAQLSFVSSSPKRGDNFISQHLQKWVNDYINSNKQSDFKTHGKAKNAFSQGLMGFIGYDMAADFTVESFTAKHNHLPVNCPLLHLGHYDIYLKQSNGAWYIHYEPEAYVIAAEIRKEIEHAFTAHDLPLEAVDTCHLYNMTPQWNKTEYADAFERIQNYLRAGDCYQVNLAQNITANYTGNPASLIDTLHQVTKAPYAGFLQLDDYSLLSCSPELFMSFDANGTMTTKPIKGTLPRLPDETADAEQVDLLKASEKNRAENLMIVDLLRNDLSVYAKTGSVNVPKLFEIESFAQVHHMVSTITAELKEDVSVIDVLFNALPGGSITGAPKIRAIEIIQELEKQPRGAYCGSMGYLNFDGSGEWNILIRTLQFWQGKMSLWAGGGITIASDCDDEYQECMDKISGILAVLSERMVDASDSDAVASDNK